MAECWDSNAIGAVATAVATVVALGFGLQANWRIRSERRMRVKVARRLLAVELDQMESVLKHSMLSVHLHISGRVTEVATMKLRRVLDAPVLNSYLENSSALPETVAVAIADVVAILRTYEWALLSKEPNPLYQEWQGHETAFKAFEVGVAVLRKRLEEESESCW